MIDLETERLVPIGRASRHIPGNPHRSAVERWLRRTDNPLESVKVGGRRFTSLEAIIRFIERGSGHQPAQQISARREREIHAAEARLDAAGVR